MDSDNQGWSYAWLDPSVCARPWVPISQFLLLPQGFFLGEALCDGLIRSPTEVSDLQTTYSKENVPYGV